MKGETVAIHGVDRFSGKDVGAPARIRLSKLVRQTEPSVRSPSIVRRSISIACCVALGVVLGLLSVWLLEPRLPASPTLVGLRVGGEQLPHRTDARDWLEERARAFAERRLVMRHGKHRFPTTAEELGASIDVDATLDRVLAAGHSGSIIKRMREARAARRGELDIAIVYAIDETKAAARVRRHAKDLETKPVDAELDLEGHRRKPDSPGQELDVAASVVQIGETVRSQTELDLVTRLVPAKVTSRDLNQIDVHKVLSAYETRFQVWKTGRSQNVQLTAKLLNGLVIRPGQAARGARAGGPLERGARARGHSRDAAYPTG